MLWLANFESLWIFHIFVRLFIKTRYKQRKVDKYCFKMDQFWQLKNFNITVRLCCHFHIWDCDFFVLVFRLIIVLFCRICMFSNVVFNFKFVYSREMREMKLNTELILKEISFCKFYSLKKTSKVMFSLQI